MTDNKQKPLAFVSGASRGIGRAVAAQLAQDGYDIAFCYRSNEEAAQQTKEAIAKSGRRVYGVQCDVSDYQAVRNIFDVVEAEFGEPSVIVNNAGINADTPLPMMKPED